MDAAKCLGGDGVSRWDRFGIGVSALRAVHCLLMPVLLAPVALRVARSGARRRTRIPVLLGLGIAAITVAWWGHGVWGHAGEAAMTLAGSALLIAGHWANCRSTHRASST